MKFIYVLIILIKAASLSDVTYYEILSVDKQSSVQVIRQAYKKLAVKFHPDKNPNADDQQMFMKITEAYETLKDPEKKRKYDLYGVYPSYTRKYDYQSQSEYNKLYYNGLYLDDQFVDTLSGGSYAKYLTEGFHFINFYSPFCPPCQNLVSTWKKLAELYKGIIKIGAVNCKYYNNFCYNSMRISSYPTLLFYPNGKHGNFIHYRGDRTMEALNKFAMSYINSQVYVPTVVQLRSTDKSMAYVLGSNRVDRDSLVRIAYKLNGLVTLAILEEDNLRSKLTSNEYVTVVFKYKKIHKEIESSDEDQILREIVDALPEIVTIDPDKFKIMRNELRSGTKTPWALYFSSKEDDRLLLYQMINIYPDMQFGEVDCDKWSQLCLSLQVDSTPRWGVMKPGGAYQRAPNEDRATIRAFLRDATRALTLHTLSPSELKRILDGDVGAWVLLLIPPHHPWSDLSDVFTRTSMNYPESHNIHFGIMKCSWNGDGHCRQLVGDQPLVIVQNNTNRHTYTGDLVEKQLVEFIDTLRDNSLADLTETEVMEIVDPSIREYNWLVAHLPANCGNFCTQLIQQFRIVARKLKPLQSVRVGVQKCSSGEGGFCTNVRSPTARVYPLTSRQHSTISLQNLSQAPYILEWALDSIDDSVQKLNWNAFSKLVVAEELHPTSNKKPWLVYFHSPRCYRCYEMYPDFAIAGILLNKALHLGKVNCVAERGLCQHEQIYNYPTMKLYLSRSTTQSFSSVISIPVQDYESVLQHVLTHLKSYDQNIIHGLDVRHSFHVKHDEF